MVEGYKYKLDIVVVGFGHQSLEDHLPTIHESTYFNLVGVADIDSDVAAQTAKEYDGKDFEDCLQVAGAGTNNYQEIITIDKHLQEYSHTPLPVVMVE